jgi:Ca-activated chloride channel family protein
MSEAPAPLIRFEALHKAFGPKKIYEGLNSKLVMEKKETEITAGFTAAALILAVAAAALSLLWFNRIL